MYLWPNDGEKSGRFAAMDMNLFNLCVMASYTSINISLSKVELEFRDIPFGFPVYLQPQMPYRYSCLLRGMC